MGCEVYVAPNSRFDREVTGGEDRYYHLVLLAENNEGYANLMKIVSKGFVEGYYYKPRVDKELLRKYHSGIIALSACLAGEVSRYLMKGLYDEAKKAALEYRDIFGKDHFYLELQDHGLPDQGLVNQQLLKMSRETGIELVATNDVHYTYAKDEKAHDILLCIQTGKRLADENRMRYEGGQYYIKSEEEMKSLFPYALQALENTQKIADRCLVEIEFGVTKLPKYDVPDGYTSWEYLRNCVTKDLRNAMQNGRMNFGNGLIMNWARSKIWVCRLFPDRVGFYKICERSWDRSRTGPGVCSGKYCFLLPGNYDDRPDQISAFVRAFFKSRTCFYARYRR